MIRIAVVGSKEFIEQIIQYEKAFSEIKMVPYIYDNPLDSRPVVENIYNCDVVLFAGPLPFYTCRDLIKEEKWPATYIPADEHAFMATMFHTYTNRPDCKKLSIDLPSKEYAKQVAQEINLDTSDWFILSPDNKSMVENMKTYDVDSTIRFHQELYESGKTQFAITSVDHVHRVLTELGIPNSNMMISEKTITDSIHYAITLSKLAISKNSEISIGMIVFNQQTNIPVDFSSFKQDAVIVLQQSLLKVVQKTEASIRLIGMDQFIVYGTRGSVERLMDPDTLHPFMQKVNQFGITVSMGIGFGLTAKEAEENAQAALFHAKKDTEESNVFLATADKEIVGPLHAKSKSFSLKSKDKTILNIAEKTNSSVATVSKLMQFSKNQRNKGFTTVDLSEYLGISRRSAERLLKKFLDNEFVVKVGQEQPYKKGRPRAVYLLVVE